MGLKKAGRLRLGWGEIHGRAWALLFLALVVAAGLFRNADATNFHSPPFTSSRQVVLTWDPDVDDPFYNGNAILEFVAEYRDIHPPSSAVRNMAVRPGNTLAYSISDGANSIQEWRVSDGMTIGSIALGGAGIPSSLDFHGSGRFLMGAQDDGSVEIWDFADGATSEFVSLGDRRLNLAKFYPAIADTSDLRMISAADEDTVRVWFGPGEIRHKLFIRDGQTYASAVARTYNTLVTGGVGGRIRTWDLTQTQILSPRARSTQMPGTIRELVISNDSKRLAAADETGRVHLWRLNGSTLAVVDSIDTGAGAAPKLAFSIPDGAVLSVQLPDGRLQLYDGANLGFYREMRIGDAEATSYTVTPDGRRLITGDSDGVISLSRGGRCIPSAENPVCFGGYKIWRNTRADTAGVQLLRVYGFADSTWSFFEDMREFHDPDSIIARVRPPQDNQNPNNPPEDAVNVAGPHDGLPYFYSITRFNRHFLNGSVFDVFQNSIIDGFYRDDVGGAPVPIVAHAPGGEDPPLLQNIVVVPNPYERGKVPWDAVSGQHVEFRNLPGEATIQLYTVAGDLIRVIQHGPGRYGESRSAVSWDLLNAKGREVASGMYIYQITVPSGEVIQGYLAVIL